MNSSPVKVRLVDAAGRVTEPMLLPPVVKTDAQWKAQLTPEQYRITRDKGTERAFCGIFHDNHKEGLYMCVCCGLPLYRSDAKFESGTGWPSFFQPVADENVKQDRDVTHGMVRVEILCARCDGHLGHVFPDGPKPTGMRHCLNSDSLQFVENAKPGDANAREKAIFAAGCFWGVESTFREVAGVTQTRVGYINGVRPKPTYEQVCTGATNHAEAVEIEFDPARASFEQLTELFFRLHDPTTPNRQGPDVGTQYRSGIYFVTPAQETIARQVVEKVTASGKFSRPIVTEITLANTFWPAEEYHQQYFEKNGMRSCHVLK